MTLLRHATHFLATMALALPLVVLGPAPAASRDAEEITSPGGITAWLVDAPEIPFVALELRFAGGTGLDAPGKEGAVNLMVALLEEGAGDLDAQGFAAARDALAAEFRFSAGRDDLRVSARFLTENMDSALDLLRSALTDPRFDQAALDRVRGQVLSGIEADAANPQAIASRRFNALAFGDHPYGRPGDGTAASVATLTRDDMQAAHRAALARDRVQVTAVGDIRAADLGAALDLLLGDLPAAGAARPGRAGVALTGGITVEPFPGPQSVILFGHEGIARDDPDFFAAFIVNEVLGGGRFSARLMTEVRDRRGLTYGIYSALSSGDLAEMVTGRVQTANATVAETIAVIREEWARIATEGITEAELEATKVYLTGSFPLRFDGNSQIARVLSGFQAQGYPADYAATRNDRVSAVTLEDARRAAARLFRPDALHFVVVGSPEGLETD